MKKTLLFTAAMAAMSMTASAQSAIDAFRLSRPDQLYGTARFMGMGGAFGALGGDMTTLSFNPAGIGVYRGSEIGATINFDIQSAKLDFGNHSTSDSHLNFLMNNAGYIGTAKMPNSVLRTFNWGFTYNRRANFNRRYKGMASGITNSMSNYMAGVANNWGLTQSDLKTDYPYDSNMPWISILGYDSWMISPVEQGGQTNWYGLYGEGTTGSSAITVEEAGGIDEYNISFGGNFVDQLYWGMDFGITDINFTRRSLYAEDLNNAYVKENGNDHFTRTNAAWDMYNYYNVGGTGFNYKLGLIYKPIQELRIGFAFHTPTWYQLDEYFYADTQYSYPGTDIRPGQAQTNEGLDGFNEFNLRTPWRFIASAAGVIENKMIISMDVDWTDNQYIHLSSPYYNSGYVHTGYGDPFYTTNGQIKDYYKNTVTFRAGLEYRVTPSFSLRAGYAHVSEPVKDAAKNNKIDIATAGTDPSYEFGNTTDYVTCGLGYRYKHFYIDAAYVYRHQSSDWHAFTPDPDFKLDSGAQGKLTDNNNQIVVSMGFKF